MGKTSKEDLIQGLNTDLANEYSAIIMYRTYASAVRGPFRQELRSFFGGDIADELTHAGMLADKIIAMGGTPVLEPAPVKMATEAKAMLENALVEEVATVKRYVERRRQAEELEEYGLAVELDNLIADESRHRDELQLMISRWN